MMPLSVAIAGAGGTIGPAIVRDLAASDEVSELLLLDLDGARAAAVAAAHGQGRASATAVDAREGLAESIAAVDVLVNAASYRTNLAAMRACLRAGCHYIDLGGLYRVTGEQLALDDEFSAAGLLALLGMGSAPGKTNVMALEAVRRLGAPVRRVDVIAAGRDLDPPDGPSYPYSLRTLIDELTLAPVAIRGGEAAELEPLTDGGTVELGDPIGSAETIYTLHSEIRTFAESFGATESSFRLSLAPGTLERLRGLVDLSDAEIERAQREACPPSSETVSVHVVEAEAADGRTVRVKATTHGMEAWGLGGGIVSTAAPAAAAVRLLARGSIERRGALPPERCVDPDEVFNELERRNCSFEVEERGSR